MLLSVHAGADLISHRKSTAILKIIEGQFKIFQRFPSSKLVLKAVENCFVALNQHENGSNTVARTGLEIGVELCLCFMCMFTLTLTLTLVLCVELYETIYAPLVVV
jgi:hypothetical protein